MAVNRKRRRVARRSWRVGVALLALTASLAAGTWVPAAPRALATRGDHPDASTPGSRRAVVFSPFGPLSAPDLRAMRFVQEKVEAHRYTVTRYLDTTEARDDDPGRATAANFLRLAGAGLIYVVSHGATDRPGTVAVEPNLLLVEGYATREARDNALDVYYQPGTQLAPGDLVRCDGFRDHERNRMRSICITEQGVERYFEETDAIVHIAACFSFNFREEFNARDYFGYTDASACGDIENDTSLLWGRLHGERNGGRKRAAGVAFEAGGFSRAFAHVHLAGAVDIVLSPAVRSVSPHGDSVLTVGDTRVGFVRFDTPMDTAADPTAVVTVSGCARLAGDPAPLWTTASDLDFSLVAEGAGRATITVHGDRARAGTGYRNRLDGNRNPVGTDHVGPNGDDFVWRLKCVEPHAEKIVFWTTPPDGTADRIVIMNPDGSDQRDVGPGRDPALSPNGRKIAFECGTDICLMNADGTDVRNLTPGPEGEGDPHFSPDGSKIVFVSGSGISVMNADGSNPIRLTTPPEGEFDSAPEFSPDGSRIVFRSNRGWPVYVGSDIFVVNADGTGLARLTSDEYHDADPSWFPDGGRIAFASQRDSDEPGCVRSEYDLYVMNPDGTGTVRLTSGCNYTYGSPVYSPDGTRIAFATGAGIWVMRADGTGAVQLASIGAEPDWR